MTEEHKEPLLAEGIPARPQSHWQPEPIFEGSTWQGCAAPFCCLTPLCCSSWHWKVTGSRIDLTHGCCGNEMEIVDLRRVVDIHFKRNFFQMCCDRGTIVIHSDNEAMPTMELTTFGTRGMFEQLKEAWAQARLATAVGHHDPYDVHHHHV